MLYAFFWVIPRRLNFICRRFGKHCPIFVGRWEWRMTRFWEMVEVFIRGKVWLENSLKITGSGYFSSQTFCLNASLNLYPRFLRFLSDAKEKWWKALHIVLLNSFFLVSENSHIEVRQFSYWRKWKHIYLKSMVIWKFRMRYFNPLTPNDPYRGRTAPLTSKCYILYIYSTNIGTEYFKHGIFSQFFPSKYTLFHNSKVFCSCIIHILYTGCAKIK